MFTLAGRVRTLKVAHYAVGWLRNESDATTLMRRLHIPRDSLPEEDITAYLMRRDIVHRHFCGGVMELPASLAVT